MWEHSFGLSSGKGAPTLHLNLPNELIHTLTPGHILSGFQRFFTQGLTLALSLELLLENNLTCCRIYFWITHFIPQWEYLWYWEYKAVTRSNISLALQISLQPKSVVECKQAFFSEKWEDNKTCHILRTTHGRDVGRPHWHICVVMANICGSMAHLCSEDQYLWLTGTCEIGQTAAAAHGKQTAGT